jgi:hypothetical protein
MSYEKGEKPLYVCTDILTHLFQRTPVLLPLAQFQTGIFYARIAQENDA